MNLEFISSVIVLKIPSVYRGQHLKTEAPKSILVSLTTRTDVIGPLMVSGLTREASCDRASGFWDL